MVPLGCDGEELNMVGVVEVIVGGNGRRENINYFVYRRPVFVLREVDSESQPLL